MREMRDLISWSNIRGKNSRKHMVEKKLWYLQMVGFVKESERSYNKRVLTARFFISQLSVMTF